MFESTTKTVDDVIKDVQRQFGDESEVQIDSADIIRWVNNGQRDIVTNNVELNAVKAVTNIVANQQTYPILSDPAFKDLLTVRSIRFKEKKLRSITFQEAEDYMVTNPQNAEGEPELWYVYAGEVNLYPIPQEPVEGGLTVFFTKAPAKITSSSDLLGIPDSYYNALVDYAMSKAYELDENANMSQLKTAQYEKSLNIQQNRTTPQTADFPTIRVEVEDMWY